MAVVAHSCLASEEVYQLYLVFRLIERWAVELVIMLRPLVLQNCHSDKPEFHAEVQNHEVSSPFLVLALFHSK